MSLDFQRYSHDPGLGNTINKGLVPSIQGGPEGADHSVMYWFYKTLSGLREILKKDDSLR